VISEFIPRVVTGISVPGGALGHGGSMTNNYESLIRRKAIHHLSGFFEKDQYYIARASLPVPQVPLKKVFPSLNDMLNGNVSPTSEESMSLFGFLQMMKLLRCTIIQDSCLLIDEFPSHSVWKHPLYFTKDFIRFLFLISYKEEVCAACLHEE
jgi:hypothetical protein